MQWVRVNQQNFSLSPSMSYAYPSQPASNNAQSRPSQSQPQQAKSLSQRTPNYTTQSTTPTLTLSAQSLASSVPPQQPLAAPLMHHQQMAYPGAYHTPEQAFAAGQMTFAPPPHYPVYPPMPSPQYAQNYPGAAPYYVPTPGQPLPPSPSSHQSQSMPQHYSPAQMPAMGYNPYGGVHPAMGLPPPHYLPPQAAPIHQYMAPYPHSQYYYHHPGPILQANGQGPLLHQDYSQQMTTHQPLNQQMQPVAAKTSVKEQAQIQKFQADQTRTATNKFSAPQEKAQQSQFQQASQPLPKKAPTQRKESHNPLAPVPKCKVVLQVSCMTNLNQRVAVVGNAPSLGSWDANKAFLLATEQDKYPVWVGQFLLEETPDLPRLEYKFVKLTTDANSGQIQVEWESIFENRFLEHRERASVVVDEIFGDPNRRNEIFVRRAPVTQLAPAPQLTPVVQQPPAPQSPVKAQQQVKQAKPAPEVQAQQKSPSLRLQKQTSNASSGKPRKNSIGSQKVGEAAAKNVLSHGNHVQTSDSTSVGSPSSSPGNTDRIRRLLKQQLRNAFPVEFEDIDRQKEQKKKKKTAGAGGSDTTSNETATHGSLNSTFNAKRKSLNFLKKHMPKSVKLDPNECIIQVTHQLPYRLVSKEPGHFSVDTNYPSPALLFANLDELAQTKTFNFVWVGIVVTKHALSEQEEALANKKLAEKNCYAIFYTEEQILPFLRFYEGLIRPNMHNFVDPGDHMKAAINDWAEFKAVNSRVARRVHQVRQLLASNTILIHGDQFMLVPYFTRQSEKVKANIGFYFHQAFPASAVFQSFYKREELLQGLLHSDLIGFHIWEYARNFINSCQRLLGLFYELGVGNTLSVNYNKRSVQVRIWHIGLDESFVEKIMESQKYQLARLQVVNTVKNATAREERASVKASVSRGNLNQRSLMMRSAASQPMLIGGGLAGHRPNRDSINSTLASSFADNSSNELNEAVQGKTIIASIDSFHQMTGLILKLKGYQKFLQTYPEYRDKVVLFQVIRGLFVKSDNVQGSYVEEESKQGQGRSNVDKSQIWLFDQCESLKALNTSIIKLVNQIRREFGRQCLIVESGNWSIQQRFALWSKAQVLFVSTLKDGLYLTCFEYIHVKHLCNQFQNSALCLSEFTGCNSQFAGFYDFNPFQLKTTVQALAKSIQDSPSEKAERMKRAFMYCRQRTFRGWIENFLKELKLAYDPASADDMRILYQGLQTVQYGRSFYPESERGPNRTQVPAALDIRKTALQAVSTRKNLFMIDHEALPIKQLGRSDMCPRTQILHSLQEILYDKNNIVVILSDRDRAYLQSVFDPTMMEQENFWVAAESGYWLMTNQKQWTELFKVQNKLWMQTIRQIMQRYCENIDGSVVEERSCTVLWNYKNAEEEHGSKFANELTKHLQHLIGRHSPIEIVHGNGFIEVCPKQLDKKAVLSNIYKKLQIYCNVQVESLLFIGADLSNNQTFQFLKQRIDFDKNRQADQHTADIADPNTNSPLFAASCKHALCVIGNHPSQAQFFLEQKDVQFLLQEMAFKTQSRKRNRSMTNLLDSSVNNSFDKAAQNSNGEYSFGQERDFDVDSMENHNGALESPLQTSKRRGKMKNRHFSQLCLFQPISITEKTEMYQAEEPITETFEEDNMTQMSEVVQQDGVVKDYVSALEGSVQKNGSREQVTLAKRDSQIEGFSRDMNQIFDRANLQKVSARDRIQSFVNSSGKLDGDSLESMRLPALQIESSNVQSLQLDDQMPKSPHLSNETPTLADVSQLAQSQNGQQWAHESASMPQLQAKPPKAVAVSARAVNHSQGLISHSGTSGSGPAAVNEDILIQNMDLEFEKEETRRMNRKDTPSLKATLEDLAD